MICLTEIDKCLHVIRTHAYSEFTFPCFSNLNIWNLRKIRFHREKIVVIWWQIPTLLDAWTYLFHPKQFSYDITEFWWQVQPDWSTIRIQPSVLIPWFIIIVDNVTGILVYGNWSSRTQLIPYHFYTLVWKTGRTVLWYGAVSVCLSVNFSTYQVCVINS